MLSRAARLISGWPFPAFLVSVLGLATVLLVLVLLVPADGTVLEQFAEEFKVWCFGYDPETGELSWGQVFSFTSAPVMLIGITLLIWWAPLRDVVREAPRRLWAAFAPALVVVAVLSAVMGLLGPSADASDDLPFPAERLRIAHEPPAFSLVNQHGEQISLESLRGRVVVVTGVYSSCGTACPMILAQARRVVESLSEAERADVSVIGITLDPEHDTPGAMANMALAQRIRPPAFHLVSGEPSEVGAVLDRFDLVRRRDPATGVIDHANLFIVVDRRGRIAYRFSLGEQQERWLGEALRLLVRERPAAG